MCSEFEARGYPQSDIRFDNKWLSRLIIEDIVEDDGLAHARAQEPDGHHQYRLLISSSPDAASRVEHEYSIYCMLDSDCVEQPLALVRDGDRRVLVFAKRDGRTIDAIPREDFDSLDDFLELGVQIASALSRVHQSGVVHAGLRPSNILLGRDKCILFSSFGLSFASGEGSFSARPPVLSEMAYTAPEQARLDRPIADRRSDLYSLGVVLYEVLTGHPPLVAETMAQWLHAHVAMEATPPREFCPVPDVVEQIVMKLISKDPALRYQTAHALHADMIRCQTRWKISGSVSPFMLARADPPQLKPRSETLFGRSVEMRRLAEIAARVALSGEAEIVLVSGASGAGKSALVDTLPKIVGKASLSFATGKSDQLLKDIPFSPFSQILLSLIAKLLSASATVVQERRQQLLRNLGTNSALLLDLVPEAEFVLGSAAKSQEVPGSVSEARMARAIAQALAAFSDANSPLVLFLDDVQWADDATTTVIKSLLDQRLPHLLLIIAYRDEAIGPSLSNLLKHARSNPSQLNEISLSALTTQDTADLIASVLNDILPDDVNSLAELVQQRTGGNAFYVNQFIRTLVEQNAINFDLKLQRWTVDQRKIAQGSDVIDFLSHRLKALSAKQRNVLRMLALLGGQGELALVSRICGLEADELELAIKPLFEAGFLHLRGSNLSISHDRVLETAYRLTDKSELPNEHSRVASLLLEASAESGIDRTFQIAHQIERAAVAFPTLGQPVRLAFVRILVTAARRVRNTGAVRQSVEYLEIARALSVPEWETSKRTLLFEVDFLYCECLINLARLEAATAVTERLTDLAGPRIEKANVHRLKAVIHTVRCDYESAIADALAGLSLLGIVLQRHPTTEDCDAAYELARDMLSLHTLPGIIAMREATDVEIRASLALLATLSSSFFVEGALAFSHVAKIVELSLKHGVVPETAYGLAWFGVFSASRYGVYEEGYDYAAAASELVLRGGFESQRTGTLVALDQITPWTRPLQDALKTAREAAKVGYAADDLGMTCYARNHIVSDLIALGTHLTIVRDEVDEGLALIREVNYDDIEFILRSQSHFVQSLMYGHYRPTDSLPMAKRSIPTLFWTDFYDGMSAYFFDHEDKAVELLARAMEFSWSVPAHIDLAYGHLFMALALARQAAKSASPEDVLPRLDIHRSLFKKWAELNASTFGNKLALIEAEMAALAGDFRLASAHYELSTELAEEAGFVHEQALAHELAGAFYQRNGLRTAARSHIQTAHASYILWGADGKASQIQLVYPEYFSRLSATASARTDGQANLDLEVVIRTSQALSEEIVLESVVAALMRDMIIHAGARYGLLLLMQDEQPVIEACGRVSQQEVVLEIGRSVPTADALPSWVLNAVIRKKKSMVFSDAFAEALQVREEGPSDRTLRSVLCLPLIKRGSLVGVMYLENNLAPGVFTPNRVAMLEILAPQAAISLDAARLYRELTEENVRRARTEADLMQARSELARTSQLTLMGGLAASIAHEINQPLASIVSNADASTRWLNRNEPNMDEAIAGLHSIRENGIRAASIVKALRSLAKQSPSAIVDVDLSDVVREVIRLTSPEIAKNAIDIDTRIELGPNLVRGDAIQLQQVILNLVTNAMDALSEMAVGKRKLRIEVAKQSKRISVRVEDKGKGIATETLRRIFDPFFSTKATGMGMGLAICQSILDAHRGRLEVQSRVDEGTVFFFSLPVAQ